MMGPGLLAEKGVERRLTSTPWVKTSLAPGPQVVTEYSQHLGLTPYLEKLGLTLSQATAPPPVSATPVR